MINKGHQYGGIYNTDRVPTVQSQNEQADSDFNADEIARELTTDNVARMMQRLSESDILLVKEANNRLGHALKGEIEESETVYHETGVTTGRKWYNKKKAEVRARGRIDQSIAGILAVRRRERQNNYSFATSYNQQFVNVAREWLKPEDFDLMKAEASKRAKNAQRGNADARPRLGG